MPEQPKINRLRIDVRWRTMETQGPQYLASLGELDIYFVDSVSSYEIERKVKEAFGIFIESWTVIEETTTPAVAGAEGGQQ